MKSAYGDVVLITGASSGMGKAISEYLRGEGFKVYGTSRKANEADADKSPESLPKPESFPKTGFIKMVQLDVCSENSVKNAVKNVMQKEGRIDILINNAGFGIAGSVEDTSIEEAYKQFDTNFFGMLRMCREVIPIMRSQHKGLIINISSVAGQIAIPYQSMYSASKYSIEAVSEAMRTEVRQFGINVSIVEPGDTHTGFTEKRQIVAAANNSVYSEHFKKSLSSMEKSELNGPSPARVVKEVSKIISSKNPPVKVTAGFFYKTVVFLKRLLPVRFVAYAVSKMY